MPRDLLKTLTYLSIHLTVGFSVAYAFTGSLELAGGIALIEPCINAVAFFFHEKLWKRADARVDAQTTLDPFVRDAVAHG
jgi:uncharacterized membrane protein